MKGASKSRVMKHLLNIVVMIGMNANANTDAIIGQALNNLSHEYVQCAAYFEIAREAIRQSGDDSASVRSAGAAYKQLGNTAMQGAVIAAQRSGTVTKPMEVTLARHELALKEMASEISNDTSNIAILINQYAKPCTILMKHPERAAKRWMNRMKDRW
jgi:hypothetical protein